LINDYSGSPYGDAGKAVPCLFTLSEWWEGADGCSKVSISPISAAGIDGKSKPKQLAIVWQALREQSITLIAEPAYGAVFGGRLVEVGCAPRRREVEAKPKTCVPC
jgi:hypothetical protein